MGLHQGHKQINDEYAEEIDAYVDMVEAYKGQFGNKHGYLHVILQTAVQAQDPQTPQAQS